MACSLKHIIVIALAAGSIAFESTLYVNKGEQFTVPCKNDTPGNYYGVIWKERVEIYAQLPTTGLKIHRRIFKRSRLVNGTSLQIDSASLDDAGVYECNLIYLPKEINFPHVVVPSLVTVVVFAPPSITSFSPVTQYHRIGGEASIECKFQGIPFANVTWKFDGKKDLKNKYATINNTSVLKLRRLRKKDSGFYTCVTFNRAGQMEKKAHVRVTYSPKVTYITQNPRIDLQKTGTIACKAKGFPLPVIYWYLQKEDSEVSLSAGARYKGRFLVSTTKSDKEGEWSQSQLTIHNLQAEDWKINYTCVASNEEGSIDEIVHVTGFGVYCFHAVQLQDVSSIFIERVNFTRISLFAS